MPFWVFGHDAVSRQPREPLYLDVASEELAREAAARQGMAVEFVDRARPTSPPSDRGPAGAPTPPDPLPFSSADPTAGAFAGFGAAVPVGDRYSPPALDVGRTALAGVLLVVGVGLLLGCGVAAPFL